MSILQHRGREVLELMRTSGVMTPEGPNLQPLLLDPEGRALLGWVLSAMLAEYAPTARVVGGLATGATQWATAAADVSQQWSTTVGAFYVRKEPKGRVDHPYVEGLQGYPTGTPVVVIDDVVRTGRSLATAARRVTELGFKVVGVFGLVKVGEVQLTGDSAAVLCSNRHWLLHEGQLT